MRKYTSTETFEPPRYIGGYSINNELTFNLTKKPSQIKRFFTKVLMGWDWIDYDSK